MSDILHLTYKNSASLADEVNSAYCQFNSAHKLNKYKPMEISIKRSTQH